MRVASRFIVGKVFFPKGHFAIFRAATFPDQIVSGQNKSREAAPIQNFLDPSLHFLVSKGYV